MLLNPMGGSWRIFDDSSVTIAQWRRAQDLTKFGYPQVPGSIPRNPINSNQYGFEQIDPEVKIAFIIARKEII